MNYVYYMYVEYHGGIKHYSFMTINVTIIFSLLFYRPSDKSFPIWLQDVLVLGDIQSKLFLLLIMIYKRNRL